jgi:hypothetical protein
MPSATRTRLLIASSLVGVLGAAGVMAVRYRSAAQASDALALALLEVRGEMCSGRNLKGTGVRMEVFANGDLTAKPIQSGLVPVLDLNVSPSAPVATGQTVRWSGWVKAPASGAHLFHLPAGVRGTLTVSKIVVLDAGLGDSTRTEFEEARFYPFTLVVTADHAATEAGTWLLSWSQVTQAAQPVTRGYLFPPTDAVKPSVASAGSDK